MSGGKGMSAESYRNAKDQIAQLEAELAEFQASSRELEKELELELEESEQRLTDLSEKVSLLTNEVSQWKKKYNDLQKEYGGTQASLQKQIASLQEAHQQVSKRLMEIEMTNDDMERNERITKTSLEELEQKYYGSLEEIAMLESDLATKDTLAVDLQRSKDELRDTKEELSVAHSRIEMLERQLAEAKISPPTTPTGSETAASSNKMRRKTGDSQAAQAAALFRSASRLRMSDPSAATTPVNATADRSPPPYYYVSSSGTMVSSAPPKTTTNLPRMTSSKSLRKIHGMLDQMKNLETRVAHFKSSLPKPVTPIKGSPTNTPSPRSRSMAPITTATTTTTSPESSPSNLPVASIRRSSPSMNFIGKPFIQSTEEARRMSRMSRRRDVSNPPDAIEEEKFPTKYRLDPIQGSPVIDHHVKKRSTDGFTIFSNTSSTSLSSRQSTDEKLLSRPGSAFSALHTRSSIGHGRYF